MPDRSSKHPDASALGRRGGLKGGPARAAKLSKKQRSEIASRAARARWEKARKEPAPGRFGGSGQAPVPGEFGLSGAEARFRALVERIPAVVYTDALDDKGTTVYISPQVESLLEYPLEEWNANPGLWFEALHPDDRDEVFDEYMRRRETGEPWTMEYRMIARGGRVVWIREDDVIARDWNGEPVAVQGVMFDITAQKQAEEQLKALDSLKGTLLHAVSHDLKGPLSAILGATTLLLDNHAVKVSPEDAHRLLEGIENSTRKMDRLVTNLLDLDRLDKGILEPRRETFDIGELVERVSGELDLPPGRSIQVEVEALVIRADPVLVERIVENLVLNATKHTAKAVPVWVRVRAEEDRALIAVEDAGEGVPQALRETIFEPFRRGGDEGSLLPTGAGIGLSLVARFAQLHGGLAWVEERTGGGASFRVALPRGRVPA
ncbi:MAG: ATP-binding protein [Actinomycetota bacterium]